MGEGALRVLVGVAIGVVVILGLLLALQLLGGLAADGRLPAMDH